MAHDTPAFSTREPRSRPGSVLVSAAQQGIEVLARCAEMSSRVDQDRVLWLSASSANLLPTVVTSLRKVRRSFCIESLALDAGVILETALHDRHPRLLVADVDWCAQVGVAALRRLHRHRPEIDWLLCWDEASPRWLDILVHTGARGAVLRGADEAALARAFDAVVAGELWLPRQVMQWLYATLVDAPGDEHSSSIPASQWPMDDELTPREGEVAALMRHGLTNRDIAERLGISVNTVKKHLASAYEKQGVRSRRQMRR